MSTVQRDNRVNSCGTVITHKHTLYCNLSTYHQDCNPLTQHNFRYRELGSYHPVPITTTSDKYKFNKCTCTLPPMRASLQKRYCCIAGLPAVRSYDHYYETWLCFEAPNKLLHVRPKWHRDSQPY